MSRRAGVLPLLLAAFAAPLGVGATFGAFSSTTSNPASSFSAASSFCVTPGTQTVTADADAWVDELAPLQNNGTAATLDVASSLAVGRRRALVRFPLPAVPHNCDVTGATLRLSTSTLDASRTLDVHRAGATWSEGGVTWATQPIAVGAAASASAAGGWVAWTVTGQVQALYSGTNTGFVVADANEILANATNSYSSREEAAGKPELSVTFG